MASESAGVSNWGSILVESKVTFLEDGLVASALPVGPNARFYEELFAAGPRRDAGRRTLWETLKRQTGAAQSSVSIDSFVSVLDRVEHLVGREAVVVEVGGGIYQKRSANAYQRFPRYVPLDLSASSICRYAREFRRPGIIADATSIPIRDCSVDAVFTRTFLEHVPDPESALREIFRIVRPGGVIIHQDSWFCRWWHRYAVVGLIPWAGMTFKERVIYMSAQATEFRLTRAFTILMSRLQRELLLDRSRLHFRRLRPNYELHLGCDEDAASSLDPAEVARFYDALGATSPSHGRGLARVMSNSRRLEIHKPVT